ncbi:hypothetical protein BFJ71_g16623 [Fusarium oxysporum]|nr:hypothetical protein BFJ71_g16623 [Fusarium oxysporum]
MADGTGVGRNTQSTRFTDLKPWLERTGWEQTFQGVNRELLRNLTAVPSLATLRQGLNHEIWKQPDALAEALWQSTKCPAAVDAEDDLDEESIDEEGHSEDNASSGYESSVLTESEDSEDDFMNDGQREYQDDEALERDQIENQNGEIYAIGG